MYLAHTVDKDEYGLKLIPITEDTKVEAKKEAEMYVQLNYPNILKARVLLLQWRNLRGFRIGLVYRWKHG